MLIEKGVHPHVNVIIKAINTFLVLGNMNLMVAKLVPP